MVVQWVYGVFDEVLGRMKDLVVLMDVINVDGGSGGALECPKDVRRI